MLTKAQESLEEQTAEVKFVGSETLAFDRSQLSEAREIFERCFDELIALSKKSAKRQDVYHMAIQFFTLTQSKADERQE